MKISTALIALVAIALCAASQAEAQLASEF
jgi:hypothetical protein